MFSVNCTVEYIMFSPIHVYNKYYIDIDTCRYIYINARRKDKTMWTLNSSLESQRVGDEADTRAWKKINYISDLTL